MVREKKKKEKKSYYFDLDDSFGCSIILQVFVVVFIMLACFDLEFLSRA